MGELKNVLQMLDREETFENIFLTMCSSKNAIAAEYLDQGEVRRITYYDYEGMIGEAAHRIFNKIHRPYGSFIGLKLDNGPLWPIALWGILAAGFRPLLIDSKLDAFATKHVMNEAGATVLISESEVSLFGVTHIRPEDILDITGRRYNEWRTFGNGIALCTSGTTTSAKVYLYDGKAISCQLRMARGVIKKNKNLMFEGTVKTVALLPFHHILGFIGVYLWYSAFGKTIVYLKDRTPEVVLSTCKELNVSIFFAVPLFWNNLADGIIKKARLKGQEYVDKFYKYSDISIRLQKHLGRLGRLIVSRFFFKDLQNMLFGQNIRFLVTGGGHIPAETLKIINSIGYHLANGFGMTETGLCSLELSNNIEKVLQGSVGETFPSTWYKLQDGPGISQLLIKGKALHSGRLIGGVFEPRDADAYFETGDLAHEQHGRFFITGRLKEVIVGESGENVYPDELEERFISLPGAERYCVTGLSGSGSYDDIALIVDMGTNTTDGPLVRTLIDSLVTINANLPIHKRITRAFIANQPLPLANGIKVKRNELKKMIENDAFVYTEIDLRKKVLLDQDKQAQDEVILAVQAPNEIENDLLYKEIKERIRSVFADVLTLNPSDIGDDDHFVDDLGGNSLSSLALLSKAEESYGVILSDTDYYSCVDVRTLSHLLYCKITGKQDPAISDLSDEHTAARKVSSFEESLEFKEFVMREDELSINNIENPFFIPHDSALKDVSVVRGKQVINFGSYNYLGFSGHPETTKAAKEALDRYGVSTSGSRLIAGEKPIHQQLELAIAHWKHTEDAIVCVGGHSTNVTFIGNFCGKNDLILYDALSHNSIRQGCQLSASDTRAFPHNDFKALEYMLKTVRPKYEKILVIIEGVYSMDGDIAPMHEFVRLKKKYGAFLMVDEAHSACVIGKCGGGVDDYFNLKPDDIDIRMGTLSKGIGAGGGYLAGSTSLISYLRYNMPGFVFADGLSPVLAAASKCAIDLLMRDHSPVTRLQDNIHIFIEEAQLRGFNTCLAGETAIVPILIGDDLDAYILSERMLKRGVFVPSAVFPAVPHNQARLRFCLTSEHKSDQIVYALETLKQLFEDFKTRKVNWSVEPNLRSESPAV